MYYRIAIATLVAGIAVLILAVLPVPDAISGYGVDPGDRQVDETCERARLLTVLLNQKGTAGSEAVDTTSRHLQGLLEASTDPVLRQSATRLRERASDQVDIATLALVLDRACGLSAASSRRVDDASEHNATLVRGGLALVGVVLVIVGASTLVKTTASDRFELKACLAALPVRSGGAEQLSFRILRLETDRKRMARDLLSSMNDRASLRMRNVELSEQLQFDDLTRLYTARGLLDAMDPLVDGYLQNREQFTLLAIDLDLFKQVNTYGHSEGDRALGHYADGLRAVLGQEALAARPSGDEFLAVIQGHERETLKAVDRLRTFMAANPFVPAVEGARHITLRATFGYVCVGDVGLPLLGPDHTSKDRRTQFGFLIHYGDKALTHAKHTERGSVHKYDPDKEYTLGAGTLPRGVGNAYSLIERNIHTAWEKLDLTAQQLLSGLLHRAARILVPDADLEPDEVTTTVRSNGDDDPL